MAFIHRRLQFVSTAAQGFPVRRLFDEEKAKTLQLKTYRIGKSFKDASNSHFLHCGPLIAISV